MEKQTIFELIHMMDQLTNNMIIKWNKMFEENLGISHILVLNYLKEHGKSRPSDIAKALGLTPPSLTHLSEKLVQKELAIRVVDQEDRRIIYLSITNKGVEMVHTAHEKGKALRTNLFEALSEEERQQLLTIYEKLNHSLEK
ncbi:MarR family transcriptional regulator [Peribacillus asahii]|uniref:MarR family transcriptional regulator n=1 Tax=Peribacillus asahii TaxID=228899 RepID=A0A398B0A6_9BACI|nr:MarR family transcriptional regulator [Peribacillus asahii]RID82714.1 MarR family transcriptional regulator [Peribacillus asahii]